VRGHRGGKGGRFFGRRHATNLRKRTRSVKLNHPPFVSTRKYHGRSESRSSPRPRGKTVPGPGKQTALRRVEVAFDGKRYPHCHCRNKVSKAPAIGRPR